MAAWLQSDRHGYVLNVGDSRAYHISATGITQITRDHSLVADLVARGKITPEEARNHPNKNIITRALGTERNTEGDLFEVDLDAGDYILLCSDGLSNVCLLYTSCTERQRGTGRNAEGYAVSCCGILRHLCD